MTEREREQAEQQWWDRYKEKMKFCRHTTGYCAAENCEDRMESDPTFTPQHKVD